MSSSPSDQDLSMHFAAPLADWDGVEAADTVLDAALYVGDWRTARHTALQLAHTHFEWQMYESAASYFETALDCHRRIPLSTEVEHLALELRLLERCALMNLYLCHFSTAGAFLVAARRSADLAIAHYPHLGLDRTVQRCLSNVAWTSALVNQFANDPHRALDQIERAVPGYITSSTPLELVRLRLQVANIALNASQMSNAPHAHYAPHELLSLAWHNLDKARPQPGLQDDLAGEALFQLAYAKYSRVTNRNESRIALLESTNSLLQRLHDLPGRIQVFTALGHEFTHLGEWESAHSCYRLALDLTALCDLRLLGKEPLRALQAAGRL